MKFIITGAVCLMAGIIVGRLLPHETANDTADDYTAMQNKRRAQRPNYKKPDKVESLRLSRQSRSSEANHRLADSSGLPDPAAFGKLVTVPAYLIQRLGMRAGTPSLDEDFFSKEGHDLAALQITDAEKAAINQAWRKMGEDLKKLEIETANIKEMPDGSVQIIVPDLSKSNNVFDKGFREMINNMLGNNRAEVLLAMKQVKTVFLQKQGKLTYSFKIENVGDGQQKYRIHRYRSGDGLSSRWSTLTIPTYMRHLTDKAGIQPRIESAVE